MNKRNRIPSILWTPLSSHLAHEYTREFYNEFPHIMTRSAFNALPVNLNNTPRL